MDRPPASPPPATRSAFDVAIAAAPASGRPAPVPAARSRRAAWVLGACAALLGLGGGAALLARRGGARALLASFVGAADNVAGARGGHGAASTRYLIGMGSVTNNSGVRGEELAHVAQQALEGAVAQRSEVALLNGGGGAPTQRAARGGHVRGHFFDATIQSVRPSGSSTRVVVSVAVSSYPGRVYEFESQSSIMIAGGSGASAAAQDDGVRQAIQSAANSAINQILQGVP